MRRGFAALILAALSCPLAVDVIAWEDWSEPLELSGVEALARNGDDPSWSSPEIPEEGWIPLPLRGNYMASHPDWGPVIWLRFTIRLPAEAPGEPLTLWLGKIADFDRCYFNGLLIGENAGYRGKAPDELFDLVREYKVPVSAIRRGEGNLVAIRIDNRGHSAGGLLAGPLLLSLGYQGRGRIDPTELPSLALIAFYVISGLYFLYLFLTARKSWANLLFGVFCLSLSLYFLSMLQLRSLFFEDYIAWMRLRFASLWSVFPLFLGFMLTFMRRSIRIRHYVYFGLSLALQPIAWFWPSVHRLSWINAVIVQPSWLYPVVVVLFVLIRLRRQSRETQQILGVLCGFCLILAYDILRSRVVEGPLSGLPYLTPYGFGLLILGFSLVLTNRQIRLKAEMERLFTMATEDSLTGLSSRAHIENYLNLEILEAKRSHRELCVIMADLDHFKEVNDLYGHPAGDVVLREFGSLLKRSIRIGDMAGRYGGEEFLVVLPQTSREGASLVARRINREQARRTAELGARRVVVTVSMGVADLAEGRENLEDIMKASDEALYKAKRGGRNRVELAPETGRL